MVWRHLFGIFFGFCLAVALLAYYLFAIVAATILFAIGIVLMFPLVTAPLGLTCIALGFKLLNP